MTPRFVVAKSTRGTGCDAGRTFWFIDAEVTDHSDLGLGIEGGGAIGAGGYTVTAAVTEVSVDHPEAESSCLSERCDIDRTRRAGANARRRFFFTILSKRRRTFMAGVGEPEAVDESSLFGARVDAE